MNIRSATERSSRSRSGAARLSDSLIDRRQQDTLIEQGREAMNTRLEERIAKVEGFFGVGERDDDSAQS